MDFEEAVGELYGCDLADFVPTRTRLAALVDDPDDAAQVRRMRKPTVTAWLLNLLAREDPDLLAEVDDLGQRMRRMQAKGDARGVLEVRPERDDVLRRMVAAVAQVSRDRGRPLPTSGGEEVSATVIAALADQGSAAALLSGMLVRSLSYSGFGEVDLDDAVAARTRLRLVPTGGNDGGGEPADGALGQGENGDGDEAGAADAAERELTEAMVRLETAEADLVPAQETLDEAQAEMARAQAALTGARERLQAARAEVRRRTQTRDAVQQKVSALRRGAVGSD